MNKVAVFISKYKFGLVALLFFVLAVAFLFAPTWGSVRYGFSLSDKLEEIEKGQLIAIYYTTVSSEDDIVGASAYAFKCFVITFYVFSAIVLLTCFFNAKNIPLYLVGLIRGLAIANLALIIVITCYVAFITNFYASNIYIGQNLAVSYPSYKLINYGFPCLAISAFLLNVTAFLKTIADRRTSKSASA